MNLLTGKSTSFQFKISSSLCQNGAADEKPSFGWCHVTCETVHELFRCIHDYTISQRLRWKLGLCCHNIVLTLLVLKVFAVAQEIMPNKMYTSLFFSISIIYFTYSFNSLKKMCVTCLQIKFILEIPFGNFCLFLFKPLVTKVTLLAAVFFSQVQIVFLPENKNAKSGMVKN